MSRRSCYPSRDYRNEGWNCHGAAHLWDCWNNDDDNVYVSCPPTKVRATVAFPVDVDDIPDGAVITSVTIKLRAKSTGSNRNSVTVQIVAADNTAQYTSRTIYPTSTITTYDVATYQFDPTGQRWDIHRLNSLLAQVITYCGIDDGIRCYKFWAEVNYHVRPTVSIENPTGTVLTPSPYISWTYAQADGDTQTKAEYKLFTASQTASPTFNADTAPPVVYNWVQGDQTSLTLPTSINPDDYAIYVRAYSAVDAKSVWSGRAFTVDGPAPAVPVDDEAVSAIPGVGTISVIPDTFMSAVAISMRDQSNLLAVQQADFETTSDAIGYTATGCTIARSSSQKYAGSGSMSLTSTAGGTMSASSTRVEIAPNSTFTSRAQVYAGTTGRDVTLKVMFYDAAFTSVGSTITSTVTDTSSTWREVTLTDTTPALAAYARVQVEVVSTAAGEVHYVDHVGLAYGTNTPWSHGGHVSRNLVDTAVATADDPITTEPWTAATASTYDRTTATGTGANGLAMHRLTYNGVTPTLDRRGVGTVFTSPTGGVDFTLNKPAGVAQGDLMLAFVTSNVHGSITPPVGWSAVNTASVDDGSNDTALFVLKRTADFTEPATWTDGALINSSTRRSAFVIAYSGAADADEQFVAENVSTRTADTPLYITSATLNNTDANAWRIGVFAVNDNAGSGTMTANRQPPGTVPDIQRVGVATPWGTTASGTTYTINRPPGVASGDVMLATVAAFGNVTFNAPAGWTVQRQTVQTDTSGSCSQAILERTAGGSEPSSWSGTISATTRPLHSQCVAYRNVQSPAWSLWEYSSASGSGTSITTPTASNNNSKAWRVSMFAATTSKWAWWNSTSETTQISVDRTVYESGSTIKGLEVMIADSSGPVSTGTHSRTGFLDSDYYAATAWIGILNPLSAPPSPLPNETELVDATVGSSGPWMTTAAYDSNGPAALGSQSLTGTFTPGSGSDLSSAVSWIGLIKTANPTVSGRTIATMSDTVDIGAVDPLIWKWCKQKMTMTAAFMGDAGGTPYLTLYFYRANQLISNQTIQGTSFGVGYWTKSYATFDIPDGTTRVKGEVAVDGRDVAGQVYFDRVGIAFGSSPVWRSGTSRATHPVWSVPVLQYRDDDGTGYTEWANLPGTVGNPAIFDDLTGQVGYVDHTIIPLVQRQYRAQTLSYGLAGDKFASGFGTESDAVAITVPAIGSGWWLKDIQYPERNMIIRVQATSPNSVATTNTTQVVQPLGADFPIALTEGFKGDALDISIWVKRAEWIRLQLLLKSKRTLFLQSDVDHAWWVRPVSDLGQDVYNTGDKRKTDPLRLVKVSFVQVAPEL